MISTLLKSSALAAGLCLTACAPVNPPLYYWGNYQSTLHEFHEEGATDYAGQVNNIESIISQAQAQGKSVPPGLHAHLGMLYFNTGRESDAAEQFVTEKTLFPESEHFVNYVLSSQPGVSK